MKSTRSLLLVATIVSLLPVQAAFAGTKAKASTISCPAASLGAEIAKLDKTLPDVVEFQGDCVEDIVVDGFSDLTLIGLNGASITATDTVNNTTTALAIINSTVNVESVTFYGGKEGVECTDRSVCRFRDISIHGGGGGLAVSFQATADLLGSGTIEGTTGAGIGVYDASTVNVQPNWYSGLDWNEYATTISGNGWAGVVVQDGSFFRADNPLINDNSAGVIVRRGAVAKLYGNYQGTGISGNGTGVKIFNNSTADIDIPINGSAGTGLDVGAVSTAHFYGGSGYITGLFDANGTPVNCDGVTAISEACTAFLP